MDFADPSDQLRRELSGQVHRTKLLTELVVLFSASLPIDEILEKVAAQSTEVLGQTALIVLNSNGKLCLEAAFSTDRDRLVHMLIAAWNDMPDGTAGQFLHGLLEKGAPVMIKNLQRSPVASAMHDLIEKCGLVSLIATPIRTSERILGAFISVSSAPRTFDDEDAATASVLSDFTAALVEHTRLVQEMPRSAIRDSLTGVYNARFFQDTIAREASRAQRYGTGLSLLMVDIDSFGVINDTFGHLVGDKVLAHLGGLIEGAVRSTDFVCRCGGDEFGVVLPGTTLDGARRVAEKILQRVKSHEILQNLGDGPVTVSIGAAEYQKGSHFETLVAEADQALYVSKRAGN